MSDTDQPVVARGLRVYWVNSNNTVGSDIAVRFTKSEIYFADGSWNPRASTYLTENQARKAERLSEPVPKLRKASIKAALLMNKAIELIEDNLDD